jgi:hypothetical protein
MSHANLGGIMDKIRKSLPLFSILALFTVPIIGLAFVVCVVLWLKTSR